MATTSVLVSLDIVALGDLLDIFAVLEDTDLTDWFDDDELNRMALLQVKLQEYASYLEIYAREE